MLRFFVQKKKKKIHTDLKQNKLNCGSDALNGPDQFRPYIYLIKPNKSQVGWAVEAWIGMMRLPILRMTSEALVGGPN